jgi:hypothetical protein
MVVGFGQTTKFLNSIINDHEAQASGGQHNTVSGA